MTTTRKAIERELIEQLRRTRRGRPGVVALSGPAGIGKSYLVEQLCEAARGHQARIAVGRVHQAVQRSLEPFLRIMSQLGLGDSMDGADQQLSPHHIASALVKAARDAPLVVIVEDVHWADDATLSVLNHVVDDIAFSQERVPLLLVVTERAPGTAGSVRLRETIAASTRGHSVQLAPLSDFELNALVIERRTIRPSIHLLNILKTFSSGVPLDAITLLLHLDNTGHLLNQQGRLDTDLALHDLDEHANPSQLIRHQLQDLTPQSLHHLAVLAVLGDGASYDEIAEFDDCAVADVAASMLEADQKHLVSLSAGTAAHRHSTIRTASYLSIPAVQRSRLHGRAAVAVSVIADDPIARGMHALRSGGSLEGAERFDLLLRGGSAASDKAEWQSAVEFLEAARELADENDLSAADIAELELQIAHCSYRLLDFPRCERYVDRLIEYSRRVGDATLFATAAELGVRYRVSREPISAADPALRAELDEAIAAPGTGLRERAIGLALQAEIMGAVGHGDEAAACAEEALAVAVEADDPWALGRSLFASGAAALGRLELDFASSQFERAAAAGRESGDGLVELWASIRSALVALIAGEAERSARLSSEALDHALSIQNWAEGSFVAAQSGVALAVMGRPEESAQRSGAAMTLYGRANYMATPRIAYESAARMRALIGDHHGANELLAAWEASGQRVSWSIRSTLDAMAGNPITDGGPSRPRWHSELSTATINNMAWAAEIAVRHDCPTERRRELLTDVTRLVERGIQLAPASGISFLRLRGELMTVVGDDDAIAALEYAVEVHTRNGAMVEAVQARLAAFQLRHDDGSTAEGELRQIRDVASAAGLSPTVARVDQLRQSPTWALRDGGDSRDTNQTYRVVMFTDIVGSTAIGVDHGDIAYLALVRQHDSIVRDALAAHAGFLFDTAGDGMLAWFTDAASALRAALQTIDEANALLPASSGLQLSLRVGIADGRPIERDGDLFGTTVNLAARVVDKAEIGQVWCTASVRSQVAEEQFRFDAVGSHTLKGFGAPIELARVAGAPLHVD